MSTVGIIAEFNPFHNGHRYILEQAKKITGAGTCAVIMSGSFVQRGAPAICDKYIRAESALRNGADIVFELPTRYSLQSAEAFAGGAVELLASTGIIDYLVFGSECGDIDQIRNAAVMLEEQNHTEAFNERITSGIRQGLSFPAARSAALNDKSVSRLLSSPNNILAVEYCRALLRLTPKASESGMKLPIPFTINRKGQDYSDFSIKNEVDSFASAGAIRSLLTSGNMSAESLSRLVPESVANDINAVYNHLLPITEDDFSDMLFFRLNTASTEELMSIPDINPDLMQGILKHRRETIKITELISKIKTKTFTYTAISRALFRILLYSPSVCTINDKKAGGNAFNTSDSTAVPFLRVLGFRREASCLLKQISDNGTCHIITTPSAIDRENPNLMQDVFASELYNQAVATRFGSHSESEFTKKIIIV